MLKAGTKANIGQILGMVLLMQLMCVAFQTVQITTRGMDFAVASAHADISSTNLGTGLSNPFSAVGDKANSVYDGLRIAAIGLMTLAIGASAIFMFKGRMNPTTFLWILGGGILFGAAPDIAKFFLNK